jgi:hypothetical protein
MKIKTLTCLYCEQEMESITLKKRFCSDKCRVYYNRQNRHYNGGFVYCLKNPLNENKIFYIGKTINSLNKRLREHVNNSKFNKSKEKDSIINLIINANKKVIIEELEFVENIAILDERERYWIREFSENGISNKFFNTKKGKSNPIGVRFDLDQLEIIQKEQNLTSVQQVINYLMNNYFKPEPKTVLMTPWGNIGPNLEFKPENGVHNSVTEKEDKKEPKEGTLAWFLKNS